MNTQMPDLQEASLSQYLQGRRPKKQYVLTVDEQGNPDSYVNKYRAIKSQGPMSPFMASLMGRR